MTLLEKYSKAKEESDRRRKQEYEEKILRLYHDVERSLDKNEDCILYDDTLHEGKADFARQFGFVLEMYSWGSYVYFNEKALTKLEDEVQKIKAGGKNESNIR